MEIVCSFFVDGEDHRTDPLLELAALSRGQIVPEEIPFLGSAAFLRVNIVDDPSVQEGQKSDPILFKVCTGYRTFSVVASRRAATGSQADAFRPSRIRSH